MTTNESGILEIIWRWGGEASLDIIAREAKISLEYARLMCHNLGREDYIDLLNAKLCKIKSKGKLAVAEKAGTERKKDYYFRGPRQVWFGQKSNWQVKA